MEKMIWIKQTRGTQQTSHTQKATLRALGLRRIGSENWIKDNESVRGMLNTVQHMIEADLVDAKSADSKKRTKTNFRGYTLG